MSERALGNVSGTFYFAAGLAVDWRSVRVWEHTDMIARLPSILAALAIVVAPAAAQTPAPPSAPPGGAMPPATMAPMPGGSMGSPSAGAAEVTVTLKQQNNSNENGMAKLTQGPKGLVVELQTTIAPTSPQPVHIHRGTCAKLDPKPLYPLQNVTAGTDPQGKPIGVSVTTLPNVTLDQLTKGEYAINVHKSLNDIPTYVSCGDIQNANPTGTGK